jgi:hypothetical protein
MQPAMPNPTIRSNKDAKARAILAIAKSFPVGKRMKDEQDRDSSSSSFIHHPSENHPFDQPGAAPSGAEGTVGGEAGDSLDGGTAPEDGVEVADGIAPVESLGGGPV